MNTYRYGTAYFVSYQAARNYFSSDTDIKLEEKSIFIGKPELRADETLFLNKKEGRYIIEVNKVDVK